jgi:hypothetical protein
VPDRITLRPAYTARITALWENARNDAAASPALRALLDRGAYIQEEIRRDGLLFIGIGASWGEDKPGTCVRDGVVQYETEAGWCKYPYYTPLTEMAEAHGLPFAHIDLTLFRETRQAALTGLLASFPGIFRAHYDLAFELIQEARPRIIVVNNAFVSRFIRNDEKGFFPSRFDTAFDAALGTCRIREPQALKDTPVFFSGMITGPRALDRGTKRRLCWHIGYVLEKNKFPKEQV